LALLLRLFYHYFGTFTAPVLSLFLKITAPVLSLFLKTTAPVLSLFRESLRLFYHYTEITAPVLSLFRFLRPIPNGLENVNIVACRTLAAHLIAREDA
jgi:hypothetical protein